LRWSAPIGTSAKFATPGVGAGRLYVGTRDGKVLAFGAPVSAVLTGPSTAFPVTTIGASSERTLTLTASSTVTLTKLTSSSSQFTVGSPSVALPASLSAGQSIQVPLTFSPIQTGLVGGSLSAETNQGSFSFAMSGTGQAASAQLTSTPAVVSFGGTTVGGQIAGAATFRNVGGAPLTINAVKLPAAPFAASGLPAVGDSIPAGGSVTVNLSFEPTVEGNFNGEIALETTGGHAAVGLSGSAGTAGALKITSESNEYGPVEVGATATRSFTVTNTGGTAVNITKSKPPSGSAFTATTTLPEGTTLPPGTTLTETVTFTPTAPGPTTATWALNGDDTTGLHEVSFKGTGTVPAPGSAWSHNGAATITSGAIRTTPASTNAAGSAFFTKPLDSHHLTVEFDQTINSGTGADGQTVTFADASKATPTALGYRGGGLGFSGIPGIAVAFDTYKNSANPSANFVGVTDGPGSAADLMHWLFTASPSANLRSGTHHVKVEVLNGAITVWIDATQVLSGTAAIPPRVLLGFTGATGGLTDVHEAANVVVTGEPAPSGTPASLKITSAVIAPSGSPQAGTQLADSGSCPSAFTTAALGNGESATPTLSGAVAGASCAVSQAAPSGAGWKTTASVNSGPAVELTAVGAQLAVPAFALAAGANTIQFTNTYTSASGPLIPDPSAGGWQLNGSAALEAPSLVLTGATSFQAGSAFWPVQLDSHNLSIEFELSIGGGTGADGLALVFADATRGAAPTSLGEDGGALGFGGIPGLALAFDTFKNAANPSSNFVGVSDRLGSGAGLLHWLGTANLAAPLRNTLHHVKVLTANGAIALWIDGAKVGSLAVTLPSKSYIGFSAGTGNINDRHAISQLLVNPSG
jgi:hypothetical protein